jgi:GNAT superfamily N-acetyltransferase
MTTVKPVSDADINEVLRVQRLCYCPELNEAGSAFLKKKTLFPAGCLGAWDGGQMCGYIFSHPWKSGEVVPLDTGGYAIPGDADCLYIHDLAVAPAWRGKAVAKEILTKLFEVAAAEGWKQFALVAVQDSEPFWARWGFQPVRTFEYTPGVKATYMVKTHAERAPL